MHINIPLIVFYNNWIVNFTGKTCSNIQPIENIYHAIYHEVSFLIHPNILIGRRDIKTERIKMIAKIMNESLNQ